MPDSESLVKQFAKAKNHLEKLSIRPITINSAPGVCDDISYALNLIKNQPEEQADRIQILKMIRELKATADLSNFDDLISFLSKAESSAVVSFDGLGGVITFHQLRDRLSSLGFIESCMNKIQEIRSEEGITEDQVVSDFDNFLKGNGVTSNLGIRKFVVEKLLKLKDIQQIKKLSSLPKINDALISLAKTIEAKDPLTMFTIVDKVISLMSSSQADWEQIVGVLQDPSLDVTAQFADLSSFKAALEQVNKYTKLSMYSEGGQRLVVTAEDMIEFIDRASAGEFAEMNKEQVEQKLAVMGILDNRFGIREFITKQILPTQE